MGGFPFQAGCFQSGFCPCQVVGDQIGGFHSGIPHFFGCFHSGVPHFLGCFHSGVPHFFGCFHSGAPHFLGSFQPGFPQPGLCPPGDFQSGTHFSQSSPCGPHPGFFFFWLHPPHPPGPFGLWAPQEPGCPPQLGFSQLPPELFWAPSSQEGLSWWGSSQVVSLGLSQLPGFEAVSLYSVKNGFVVAEARLQERNAIN